MNLRYIALIFSLFTTSWLYGQTAKDYKQVYEELSVFDDPLALSLKKGIGKKEINKMTDTTLRALALKILAKQYHPKYAHATYKAIQSTWQLGMELAIGSGYSKYENMTGVYLPLGKHIVMVDGIEGGKEIKLIIPNWLRKAPNPEKPTEDPKGWGIESEEFILKNGVNIIDLTSFGSLAYISYFSNLPKEEKPITVHFLTGKENGYFDNSKQSDQDWDKLLNDAVYPIMDAKGKHIQIAYPVEALKKYASGKGLELINNYDSLVYRQHRIMGLIKYNKVPENRILARVNYNYYMFRDGDGVAYMGDKVGYAMGMVTNPAVVIKGDPCWGFSHEVGHVHQTRPMFNWGGLGEVSNNLFSLYVTRSFGNKIRISEQGNYAKSREQIIDKHISFLEDPDVFNRLVPFWQLQLYFEGAGKNPDFYPDLFEAFRKQNIQRLSNYQGDYDRNPAVHQLNFIKTACEVSKTDLTEFFNQYGFFKVGTLTYDDYGRYRYDMTQEMVDECKSYIKNLNLAKPTVEISQLTD